MSEIEKTSTHVEEIMQLLEDGPLVVAEDVLAQARAARLVELHHVAQVQQDRAHLQGAPDDFGHCVPPSLDAADEDLAAEIGGGSEARELRPNGRAVPHLPRELQDLRIRQY